MEKWVRFFGRPYGGAVPFVKPGRYSPTMSSAEPQPRPLRADARRNRERIVDAARELFAEAGQATQMDDVARHACVGVGTVYRHFPTKAALLGELMATKFRHHAEVARRWAQTEDGWEAFEGFLRESFDAMALDATLQQRMSWQDSGDALAAAEAERQILSGVVGELIERAQAQGRMRSTFTVDDVPALMCAVGAVMAARGHAPVDADRFIEFVIDGLRAP
jgi:AcrR family transcriptional regulator